MVVREEPTASWNGCAQLRPGRFAGFLGLRPRASKKTSDDYTLRYGAFRKCRGDRSVQKWGLLPLAYGVEERAREKQLKGQARLDYRQEQGVAQKLSCLKAQIIEVRAKALLPQSLLAKACDYALNQWEKLEVYASHGEWR